jgi:hypothetical protein
MNLMYSCRRVAELISQSLDEPLGLIDRLRLRLHLKRCSNCGHVEQQLSVMAVLSAQLFSSDLETRRYEAVRAYAGNNFSSNRLKRSNAEKRQKRMGTAFGRPLPGPRWPTHRT